MVIVEETKVPQDELDDMPKLLRTLFKDPAGKFFDSFEQWYTMSAKREEGKKKVNEMLHGKKTKIYTPGVSYTLPMEPTNPPSHTQTPP